MKISRSAWMLALIVTSSLFFAASPARAAIDAFIKVDGIQGEGKGQWSGWIPVETVSYTATAYRDAASGMSMGKRQHEPIVIMKQIDAASPKLVQLCASGKHISSVQIAYVNSRGEVIKRAVMDDAVILTTRKAGGSAGHELEEFQFSFQRITLMASNGNKTATDDWLSR